MFLLPSEYEEHLAEHPDEVRAMLQSHIRGPNGQCAECRRCWPCRPYTSAEVAHHLILAPKPAPPPPPRERAMLAPPAPGRTQMRRTSVDGNCEWVVIAVGAVEA
jgi:5-methylcytosine-specific restriction endonuclease McrA